MEIYLIRHTTPAVVKGLIYGRTDVPLADTFEIEKEGTLAKLPANFNGVYSSPSSRCTQLAYYLSPDFIKDKRLYEVNFGLWEGKTWDTIDPEESASWMEDYINVCPPEGESMLQMQERVMDFWEELLRSSSDKIAVVTHGGVIRILLSTIQLKPLKSAFELKVAFGDVFYVQTDYQGKIEQVTSL